MNIPPPKPYSRGGNIISSSKIAMNNASPQYQAVYDIPTRPTPHPAMNLRTVGPAPPLPPRPSSIDYPVQRHSLGYGGGYGMSQYSSAYGGGYGGGYSNYGGFNGGLGAYGGYGMSGLGMSGLGYGFGRPMGPYSDIESRFIQLAEESSRPAFQSIESLVRAFSSVSMMLESTFHAMYSSFRAVIGVAENFSRLRQLFAQFFSAIAVLQFAKNFLRRLLRWFGITKGNTKEEMLWESVQNGHMPQTAAVPSRSAWPVFAFLGLLFGGPYVMSKLLGQSITGMQTETIWNPKEDPGMAVVGVHSFQASSNSELSFQRGQMLHMAPTHYYNREASVGWVLAADQEGRVGFIPSNRVARLPTTAPMNANCTQHAVKLSSGVVQPGNDAGVEKLPTTANVNTNFIQHSAPFFREVVQPSNDAEAEKLTTAPVNTNSIQHAAPLPSEVVQPSTDIEAVKKDPCTLPSEEENTATQ